MPRGTLRQDRRANAALYGVLNLLAPYVLKAVIKILKGTYRNLNHIPVWINSQYQIDSHLRIIMDKHIKEGADARQVLTRVGFIFGDQRVIDGVKNTAVYAFLPLNGLLEKYGNAKAGDKTVGDLVFLFARAARRQANVEGIGVFGKELLNFVFELGKNGKLEELLIAVEPYGKFYKSLKKSEKREKFLKASFLGTYASSGRFEKVALLGIFSEAVKQAKSEGIGAITAKIEEINRKVEELGPDEQEVINIMKGGKPIATFHELFGILKPPLHREREIRRLIGERKQLKAMLVAKQKFEIPPPLLLVNSADLKILKAVCELAKGFMLKQNDARTPIVADVYKTGQSPVIEFAQGGKPLSSLCVGLDEIDGNIPIKQIKFGSYDDKVPMRLLLLKKEIKI